MDSHRKRGQEQPGGQQLRPRVERVDDEKAGSRGAQHDERELAPPERQGPAHGIEGRNPAHLTHQGQHLVAPRAQCVLVTSKAQCPHRQDDSRLERRSIAAPSLEEKGRNRRGRSIQVVAPEEPIRQVERDEIVFWRQRHGESRGGRRSRPDEVSRVGGRKREHQEAGKPHIAVRDAFPQHCVLVIAVPTGMDLMQNLIMTFPFYRNRARRSDTTVSPSLASHPSYSWARRSRASCACSAQRTHQSVIS